MWSLFWLCSRCEIFVHTWPRIRSFCPSHISILLFRFDDLSLDFKQEYSRTGATGTTDIVYPFGAIFTGVRVDQSLVLCLEYLFIYCTLWEAELVEIWCDIVIQSVTFDRRRFLHVLRVNILACVYTNAGGKVLTHKLWNMILSLILIYSRFHIGADILNYIMIHLIMYVYIAFCFENINTNQSIDKSLLALSLPDMNMTQCGMSCVI